MKTLVFGLVLASSCLPMATRAQAQPVTVTTAFNFSYTAGEVTNPEGNLIYDRGRFFGGSEAGPYMLAPPTAGIPAWRVQQLAAFEGSPSAGVVMGPDGTLYGSAAVAFFQGFIYALTPPVAPSKGWTPTTLYTFPSDINATSLGSLYRDTKGVLYGTTAGWTDGDTGTVYSLTPPTTGQTAWTFNLLHQFAGPPDGYSPQGGVIGLADGTLLGTTSGGGGTGNGGIVFKLTPPVSAGASWTETILYTFKSAGGVGPACSLVTDSSGSVYGTTQNGGANRKGTVFKLTPPAAGRGAWTETVLHSFQNGQPSYGVTLGTNGIIYGASNEGVFSLVPDAANPGQYIYNVGTAPASPPSSALLAVGKSYLFGVGFRGGASNEGALYYTLK